MIADTLLEYLTADEESELDEHLTALSIELPHTQYQRDSIRWAVDKLGIDERTLRWSLNEGYEGHAWDGSADPLAQLFERVAGWSDVGVESGTGTGKSYGVAILILWFLACWEGAQVFTFAPTERQLTLYIWKNITELWPRFHRYFPTAELTSLCIRMRGGIDESWAAHGYPVGVKADEQVSTRAAGMHAAHMLLVYEETPGIPLAVLEAGENTCTAPHNLRVAIGNPNNQLDSLHRFCTSAGVVALRMSALDHPNVVTGNANLIPGAISRESIARRVLKYGETSPVYQSRVRGVSPEQASDALIRLEWLKASAARWQLRREQQRLPRRPNAKGVDVANSEHGDRGCIVDGHDNVVLTIDAFACPDANALGRRVVMEIEAAEMTAGYVGIDAIGVGAGTVNECRRLRCAVQGINVSSKPVERAQRAPTGESYEWLNDANAFRHLRDQIWWQAREDLRLGLIDVPWDLELVEELTTPTFVDEPRTIVENREEIVAKLGRSPDKASAFILWNWVRRRRAIALPEDTAHLAQGHDANVRFRKRADGSTGWTGPEDDTQSLRHGVASQLPVGM